MSNSKDQINQLSARLDKLINEQKTFIAEIKEIKEQLGVLRNVADSQLDDANVVTDLHTKTEIPEVSVSQPEVIDSAKEPILSTPNLVDQVAPDQVEVKINEPELDVQSAFNQYERKVYTNTNSGKKSSLERYIGENLISKIGVLIIIFGVGIGVKYAIDNDLISPLTRIMFGYILGIALFFVAIKLKQKYTSYSSVLLSGSMAIMYLVTFAAYDFYNLFSQVVAFGLMFLFTVFTVIAALNYNKQVIALIGLVGAYAVPFLLSDGSGRVSIMFSYMTIINIGILIIAFEKMWKNLYYSSFAITWIIFVSWYLNINETQTNLLIAKIFLIIFFITFYAIFLAYKLVKTEQLDVIDVFMILANSFIFYIIGYNLTEITIGDAYLGLFTLFNALIHFVFAYIIYNKKLASKNLFYLLISLVIVFVTIAFPVQLNGYWVTMFWVGEATLLFWLGRSKQVSIFEKLSYALMALAFGSLLQDWNTLDGKQSFGENTNTIIFNVDFLNAMLFLVGFATIFYFNNKYKTALTGNVNFLKNLNTFLIAIFIGVLYYTFFIEINTYWARAYTASTIEVPYLDYNGEFLYSDTVQNSSLLDFKTIWITNYTLLFTSALAYINIFKFKNKQFGNINIGLMLFSLLLFMFNGLYILSNLREQYLSQGSGEYFVISSYNITIRYISLVFLAVLMFAFYKYFKAQFMEIKSRKPFDFLLYSVILWTASSELIGLMDMAQSTQPYKLGLSILWGVYALILVVIGIIKKRKYIRIWAISLFGFTLVKLFFYDLANLDVISIIFVLVSLGILLLIISFLYNKYKNTISDES